MTSAGDLDVERIVHHRTVVMVLDRQTGERRQHVEPCQLCGVELYGVDILHHLPHELRIYASLYDGYLLLGAEYLLFIHLQLFGDIALGIDERLLSDPLLRHLVAVGVGHLHVVAEHIVVAYLEARYAGGRAFAGLYLHQVVLARIGYVAQLVELGVDAVPHHRSAAESHRSVIAERAGYRIAGALARIELLADGIHPLVVGLQAYASHRLESHKSVLELHKFAGRHAPYPHLGDQTLYVAYLFEIGLQLLAAVAPPHEILHHVETGAYGLHIL